MGQLPVDAGRSSGSSSSRAPRSADGSGWSAEGSGRSAEGSGPPQRKGLRSSTPLNRDWQSYASQVERGVRGWVSQNPPGWASALRTLFEAKLVLRSLTVGTDCEGMGAPLEALRVLSALGIISGYCHRMSCEIDGVARQWFLSNHAWPELVFSDVLKRVWPHGISRDLLSQGDQHLPFDLDLYICGFPWCPFSMRKRDSNCFDEEKARPFFAACTSKSNCNST